MKIKALLPLGLLLSIVFIQCTSKKKEENQQASAADSSAIKSNMLLASLNESAILCTEIAKAASRSANPELRTVGEELAGANAMLLKEIQDLAIARKLDLPDSLAEDKMKRVNNINKKTGPEFDKRVTRTLVNEHRIFFNKIRQTRDMDDNELKAFAERNRETITSMRANLRELPKVQRERSEAEDERPS